MKMGIAKGALHVVGTIIFIIALSIILFRLQISINRPPINPHFSAFAMLARYPVFTLAISLVFSCKHIRSLISHKIKIRILNIVFAVLLVAFTFTPAAINFVFNFLSVFLDAPLPPIGAHYISVLAIYFMAWYNLIHAFQRKAPIDGKV